MQIAGDFQIDDEETSGLTTRRLLDQQQGDLQIDETTERHPSWKEEHQAAQELNEKEAKWVSGTSSLLCLQDKEEGESEGVGLYHGGKQVSDNLSALVLLALASLAFAAAACLMAAA